MNGFGMLQYFVDLGGAMKTLFVFAVLCLFYVSVLAEDGTTNVTRKSMADQRRQIVNELLKFEKTLQQSAEEQQQLQKLWSDFQSEMEALSRVTKSSADHLARKIRHNRDVFDATAALNKAESITRIRIPKSDAQTQLLASLEELRTQLTRLGCVFEDQNDTAKPAHKPERSHGG